MVEDVLALLLPEAGAGERAGVQRVVTALRCLRDDARARAARHAAPGWRRARGELERLERRARRRAVEALLHAYVAALRPPDSFLDLGPRAMDHAAAWRLLLAAPGAHALPAPAEVPRASLERLLAEHATLDASRGARAWWRACAEHVAGPAEEAERRWTALLGAASAARPAHRARLVAGLAAARLECFEPGRALALLDAHTALARADAGLRRLLGWSALLVGNPALAHELLAGTGADVLPRPLVELRAAVPAWAELLRGLAPAAPAAHVVPRAARREELGALVLARVARRADGRCEFVALELAPGLRVAAEDRRTRWLARWTPPDGTAPRRAHRTGAAALDALGGDEVRASVDSACAHGWLRVESAHHLLPSAAQLAAAAEARGAEPSSPRACASVAEVRASAPLADGDPRLDFARSLFRALALGHRRAWWLEPDDEGTERVLAQHGRGRADAFSLRAARMAALARARRAPVNEGTTALAALPLVDRAAACVLGVLVLERPRGGAGEVLRAHEPLWWACAFRAAARRDGEELAWDPERRFPRAVATLARTDAEGGGPWLISGAPGSGRRTLARWIHFRERHGREKHGRTRHRARVLALEELTADDQRALAGASGAERVFLVARAPAGELVRRGELVPELARILDERALAIPSLAARRDEIPDLVRALAARAAQPSDGVARFDDSAVAALWRQDWCGGIAELARIVAELRAAHAEGSLGEREVRAHFDAHGLVFRARLPSRAPLSTVLEDALAVTRHAVGSANHARAARYLGWDPDTLAARLRERSEAKG